MSDDGPKWRIVITDTESESGVAPICSEQGRSDVRALHSIDGVADEYGVYECCPGPHIECWSPSAAKTVLAALNEAFAEVCD